MKIVRVTALMTATTAICVAFTVPAFAGDKGKTPGGCSNPYTLGTYDESGNLYVDGVADERNAELIPILGPDVLFAVFQSVDHNNDGALCFKLPDGWTAGNTTNRDGFYNLVDDKS